MLFGEKLKPAVGLLAASSSQYVPGN